MILILGRFQPLHRGHLKAFQKAYDEDKDLVIAIGSSQLSDQEKNPFTAEEREEMINRVLKNKGIKAKIVLVPDIPCDENYVKYVESLVGRKADKVVTENPWTEKLFKEAGYEVKVTPRYFGISATKIRTAMAEGKQWAESVPQEVVDYIKSIRGDERVRQLLKREEEIKSKNT